MNAPIPEYQIIPLKDQPPTVILAYDDFIKLLQPELAAPLIPHAVMRKRFGEGKGFIQAWREYLGFTQEEAARRVGVAQSTYQQMEKKTARPRKSTLNKIAAAFEIDLALLD